LQPQEFDPHTPALSKNQMRGGRDEAGTEDDVVRQSWPSLFLPPFLAVAMYAALVFYSGRVDDSPRDFHEALSPAPFNLHGAAPRVLALAENATNGSPQKYCSVVAPGLPSVPPFEQKCCLRKNGNFYSCLPSFIVAGAQKSGTTALAVLLDAHPSISMSAVKEPHFFDDPKRYAMGIHKLYAEMFPEIPVTTRQPNFISAEATPFYIASREVCARIALHLPHVRLVVLLRDPVERAYSEYQMKYRRVQDQAALIEELSTNGARVHQCLSISSEALHEGTKELARQKWFLATVKLCVGGFALENPKFDFFLNLLFRRILSIKPDKRPLYLDACFPPNQDSADYDGGRTFMPKCYQRFESVRPLQEVMKAEMDHLTQCFGEHNATNIAEMDAAFNACVGKATRGISSQYVYRSLYAIQLYHCAKSIPPERMMILDSSLFEAQPTLVLDSIFEFVGVPAHALASSEENVQQLLAAKYPSFEGRTSWKLRGQYEPMPEDLALQMSVFFEPFNRALQQMLPDHTFSFFSPPEGVNHLPDMHST
jgi:hypothetical protein